MAREMYEQMYEHALDYLKGWPSETALDFDAFLSADVTKENVYGGSVVHLDSAGKFMPGATGKQVAIFLHNRADDFDVSNPGGNNWFPIAPNGKMSGLVAFGPYELQTTEFKAESGGNAYAPNDLLHSPDESEVGGGNEDEAGLLYKRKSWTGGSNAAIASGTDNICGVVSRAVTTNAHGVSVLSFWPTWLPTIA
jgi:hypothetical protein